MGHVRLGTLPKTQKWNQVVSLIARGAKVEGIAAASAEAAENGLERASRDEGLAHVFWLLTQIPEAARAGNFSERLAEVGLQVSNEPTLLEIVAAFTRAVDGHVRQGGKRTDLGEMAQLAGSETLASLVGRELPEPLWAYRSRRSNGSCEARDIGPVQHPRSRVLFPANQPLARLFPKPRTVETCWPEQTICRDQ